MQSPAPDLLPAALRNTLADRLEGLLTETELSTEIVYRRPRSTSYSATTGKQTRAVAEWTFDAVAQDVSAKLASHSGGRFRTGDRRFQFIRAELPMEPTAGDEVRERGTVYKVVAWSSDPQAMTWVVTGRKT